MKMGALLVASAIGLLSFASTVQAAARPLEEDAKAFGARPYLREVDVSPSGTKVVGLFSAPGAATAANVISVATGDMSRIGNTDGKPARLLSCGFAGDEHVVCTYGGVTKVGLDLAPFSRMLVASADGKKIKPLGTPASDRALYVVLSDADVVDWMNGAEGKLLISRQYVPEVTTGHIMSQTKEGLGVDLVDLDSNKWTSVEPPQDNVIDYMSDGRGHVRLETLGDTGSGGQDRSTLSYRYRTPGSTEWRDLGQFDVLSRQGILPRAVDADTNSLYALQRMNGRDALVRIALDGSNRTQIVAKNDIVDIDDVVTLGGSKVVGYTYATDKRKVEYFDADAAKLHDSLTQALHGAAIDFEGASSDGQQLLIRASADRNPGTFYLYSRPTHSLVEVGPIRPELKGYDLAAMEPIQVPGPDGTQILSYLTLPVGSSGKNLPAVVLPHGGPSSRDQWGFDWLVQFLAARGYAVIQPQFRGSDGFGDAWLNKNGFQNWRTSIGDVTAAARYLVDKGIADRNRVAIMGWSYGGYAALQSAAVEPSLYKSVIAIAPVTDLAMLRKQYEGWSNENIAKAVIGNGPHLVEGSPLQQASRIKVPVLLAHGTMDANVAIHESEAMLAALQKVGTPVQMLKFDGLDHQLDDSEARTQLLTVVGQLLDNTIGH